MHKPKTLLPLNVCMTWSKKSPELLAVLHTSASRQGNKPTPESVRAACTSRGGWHFLTH